MSGPIPAEAPGVAKKGQDVHIPHCYILRFDTDSKNHTARRLLGQHRPQQYQGERRVTERAKCKISDFAAAFLFHGLYESEREVGNGFSRNQSTRTQFWFAMRLICHGARQSDFFSTM